MQVERGQKHSPCHVNVSGHINALSVEIHVSRRAGKALSKIVSVDLDVALQIIGPVNGLAGP